MQHRFLLTIVLLSITVAVLASPTDTKQCPVLCTDENQCCEAGGCYAGRCVSCRIGGATCQTDGQCCDAGGCYVNKCIACRTLGMSCQSNYQCCGNSCTLGHCM